MSRIYSSRLNPDLIKQGDAMNPMLLNSARRKVIRGVSVTREMELDGENVMLANADDGRNTRRPRKRCGGGHRETIIESSRRTNLGIDDNKTKHVVTTSNKVTKKKAALNASLYDFERVDEFKYPIVDINTKNNAR